MATRSSFWSRTFHEARTTGDWTMVRRYYSRATAMQLSSDINCAHRRPADQLRMRGIAEGEQWDARWERADHSENGDFVVWVRLLPVDTARDGEDPTSAFG
jgi:hypothetical protein